ncbi:sperm-associated antigen 8 [Biomphalaria pfeifferi]|uniref:Sperm-associated antigen 8 n=1 Tax=Biomphalaria pfeifferi TaxID=112525 RepID=A0AAD8AYS7_BIOPF|nr:sperm-associated antigen 8 [Biomphalaria pfeifferi]
MDALGVRAGANLENGGRNEIRINNSAGRCMLENWVEERANIDRDPPLDREYNLKERAIFLRSGHKGILTVDDKARAENLTTVRATYTLPQVDKTRHVGLRKELMEQAFTKLACEEILQEKNKQEDTDRGEPMCSIFMQDYTRDFPKTVLEDTKDHDYVNEQPITFWSEHTDKMHGITQTKTRDTAFRKNDAFSKPISEYWNQAKPGEIDKYPMM